MNKFMNKRMRIGTGMQAIILFALMISLLIPSSIAFADDPTPTTQEAASAEGTPEGEAATQDTGTSTGQAPDGKSGEPQPEGGVSPSVEAEATTKVMPEQIISQLPEGTDLVVVSEVGEVEPLVTQEAEKAIIENDPIWCPDGVTPQALVNGCTDSYSSFKDLLSSLTGTNQPSQNGVIWIAKEYNSQTAEPAATKDIVIDGNTYKTWRKYSLTLQGGWNGLGTTTVDQSSPSTFSGDTLRIINWQADVSINDVLVNAAAGNAGLMVTSTGDVTFERVESRGNKNNRGAYIDNDAGTGKVTVTDSRFTDNGNGANDDGLYISSRGSVSLVNVVASGNKDDGVEIYNHTSATRAPVQITGTNVFSGNTSDGLYIRSKGAIALENITADGNKKDSGARLDNDEAGATGGITITGNNSFSGNNDWGLQVYSRGDLNFENVVADNNKTQDGVFLDNDAGTGDILISGVTSFSGNGNDRNDDGLYITTRGSVNLVDLVATGNKDEGVEIQNTASATSATVQIAGNNLFTSNKGDGLLVRSKGDVLLENLAAQGNGADGVNVTNHTSTTRAIVSITGANSLSGNTSDGLYIRSKGAIALENITADGSKNDSGARLDNDEAGATGGITITGNNSFSGNNDWGLQVYSRGGLDFENVVADNNKTEDGAYLDNDAGTGEVKLTGVTSFSGNGNGAGDDGLFIISRGAIILNEIAAVQTTNSLTADNNRGSGVRLDNDSGTGNVLVGGFGNSISNNAYDGLWVSSLGNIDVFHLTASGNKAEGVELITSTVSPNDVNIYCSIFENNGTYGVYGRYARGSLTFQGDTAFADNKKGAYYYQTAAGVAGFNPDYDCGLPEPPAQTAPAPDGIKLKTSKASTLLIPVTGGQLVPISCEYPLTMLELAESERVVFINLCGYETLIEGLTEAEYPESMRASGEFQAGMTVVVLQDGLPVEVLPSGSEILLSFAVPQELEGASFAIVYWDPAAGNGAGDWASRQVPVVNGQAEITVNFTGTFFLVSN